MGARSLACWATASAILEDEDARERGGRGWVNDLRTCALGVARGIKVTLDFIQFTPVWEGVTISRPSLWCGSLSECVLAVI